MVVNDILRENERLRVVNDSLQNGLDFWKERQKAIGKFRIKIKIMKIGPGKKLSVVNE